MNGFLKWFFAFISAILQGFAEIFLGIGRGIKQIFNIPGYIALFKQYCGEFSVGGWILSILAIIIVVALYVVIGILIVLAIRKYIRFRHSIVSNEDLLEEISLLQQRVLKLMKEKDEIMALKVASIGAPVSGTLSFAGVGAEAGQEGEAVPTAVVDVSSLSSISQALGPTMTVVPPENFKTVRSGKDLKPCSSKDFRYMGFLPSFPGGSER